jgi:hypothetical protein
LCFGFAGATITVWCPCSPDGRDTRIGGGCCGGGIDKTVVENSMLLIGGFMNFGRKERFFTNRKIKVDFLFQTCSQGARKRGKFCVSEEST